MGQSNNEILTSNEPQDKSESIKKLNTQIGTIELGIAIMIDEIRTDESEGNQKLLENFNNRLMELKKQRDAIKGLNKN